MLFNNSDSGNLVLKTSKSQQDQPWQFKGFQFFR